MLRDIIFFGAGSISGLILLWGYITTVSPERYGGYGPKFSSYGDREAWPNADKDHPDTEWIKEGW